MKLKAFIKTVQENAGLVAENWNPYKPEGKEQVIDCQVKTDPEGEVTEATLHFSIRAAR